MIFLGKVNILHLGVKDLIGKPVKFRRGPATVSGEFSRKSHWSERDWEGWGKTLTRKPGDLPKCEFGPLRVKGQGEW